MSWWWPLATVARCTAKEVLGIMAPLPGICGELPPKHSERMCVSQWAHSDLAGVGTISTGVAHKGGSSRLLRRRLATLKTIYINKKQVMGSV
jgi:hypothetical protein